MRQISATRTTRPRQPDLESMSPAAAQRWLNRRNDWTEEEYFELDNERRLEYDNGHIEVVPVVTTIHDLIMLFLYHQLYAFARTQGRDLVMTATTKVRLWSGKYAEPDLKYMTAANLARIGAEFWDGADLVMEIVSKSRKDRDRDLTSKRRDYAKAGIPEYWIVDPRKRRITVLTFRGKRYQAHGRFGPGSIVASALLKGFSVAVDDVFGQKVPH